MLLLVAWVYMRPIFGEGIFIAGDHPFYLAVAEATAEKIFRQQRLIGWLGDEGGGFPVFSPFVPAPLGYWAMGLLHSMTGLAVVTLYKGMILLSYLVPALALWTLLSRRFHWIAAFAGSNLYLLSTYHLIQPLEGMWSQYLGLALMVVLIDQLDRRLTDEITVRDGARLGILSVASALTDAVTWPILVFLLPATVAFYARRRGFSARATAVAGLTVMATFIVIGAWLGLLFVRQMGWGIEQTPRSGAVADLLLRLPGWFLLPGGSRAIAQDIVPAIRDGDGRTGVLAAGKLLAEHAPEVLVIAWSAYGLICFARGTSRHGGGRPLFLRYLLAASAIPFLFLIGPWQFVGLGRNVTFLNSFNQERFVGYVNICLITFAAYGIHALEQRRCSSPRLTFAVGLLALLALHGIRYSTYDTHVALKTSRESVMYQELAGVWKYVRENVDSRLSRVLYEGLEGIAFLDGGHTNLAALSTRETGVWSVVVQAARTNLSFRRPFTIGQQNPFGSVSRITGLMKNLNCQYLVVWHLGIKDVLLGSGVAELAYQSQNRLFSVLRLKGYRPTWLEFEKDVGAVRLLAFRDEWMAFEVVNPYPGNVAILKVGYHPLWSASVNEQRRATEAFGGMIRLKDLPRGRVVLEFTFGPRSRWLP